MAKKRPKRRWFQFSLRTLLLVVVVAPIGLGLFAWWLQQARREQIAAEKLEKLGAGVWYGEPKGTPIQQWLQRLFGIDPRVVTSVALDATQVGDAELHHLKALSSLGLLDLSGTQVSDAGLEHCQSLIRFWKLDLSATQVTDAGLRHLKGLTGLDELRLSGTQVSDAGLEHLRGLTRLRSLYLEGSRVSAEGVKRLQRALPNCRILY